MDFDGRGVGLHWIISSETVSGGRCPQKKSNAHVSRWLSVPDWCNSVVHVCLLSTTSQPPPKSQCTREARLSLSKHSVLLFSKFQNSHSVNFKSCVRSFAFLDETYFRLMNINIRDLSNYRGQYNPFILHCEHCHTFWPSEGTKTKSCARDKLWSTFVLG